MSGKKMEGSEEQKRKKAREAKEEGDLPSEQGGTSGASKQRKQVGGDAPHTEKLETRREGKQESATKGKSEPRPGSRG